MTAPAAPNVVLSPYYRTDGTVRFNFITTPDVQGADIDIYDSDSTLVYTGAASGIQDLWTETWTLDVPVAYFGTAGNTYDVSVHVFNDDGDAYVTTSFAVYDPPTVTLLPAEGTSITGLPLTILWTVTDPTGVSAQVLRVSGASSMVYASDYSPATALDTDARSIVLDSSNMLNVPADGETCSVRISVTNGVGFVTTVTHSVSVSWQPPVTPTATVTTDPDTLAASVTVTGDRSYTFTDVESFTAPESGVITSLTVDGKSVQDGTPTPSAPVAIESVGDGGSFAIDVSGTTTTIQATLRSLPDGTHDELTVDSAGVVTLTQRVGMHDTTGETFGSVSGYVSTTDSVRGYVTSSGLGAIESTDITVNVGYSSLGPYVGNGAVEYGVNHFYAYGNRLYYIVEKSYLGEVSSAGLLAFINATPQVITYKLATPQTISLGTITPPFVAEGATVTIDAAVTPTFDATMRAAQSAGTPLTDTLMVVRVSPDGTRHVLADDLESGDTVTDPLPPLGVEYSYEVTGIAATGVPSTPATVAHTNVTTCWAMNFGTGAGEALLLCGNPRETYGLEQGGAAYHFADGGTGRGLPVWYGTTDRDISGTTTFDTVLWHEADRLQELCDQHDLGWLRDPFGHRRRVHMSPKVSHGVGEVWQVTVTWDEMRWEEPANG